MSQEIKEIPVASIRATIRDGMVDVMHINNEHLLAPQAIPYLISCMIASYLSDAVKAKMIKPEDVDSVRDLFIRDITRIVSKASKYEIGEPAPVEESNEIRVTCV